MWHDVHLVLNVLVKRNAWEVHVSIDAYHLGLDVASKRYIHQHRARLVGGWDQYIAPRDNEEAMERHQDHWAIISATAPEPSSQPAIYYQHSAPFGYPSFMFTDHRCECTFSSTDRHRLIRLFAASQDVNINFVRNPRSVLMPYPVPTPGIGHAAQITEHEEVFYI